MPSGRSLFKRIQQLLDGPGALGSGDNTKVLAWNNSTQRFEMVAQSSGGTPGGSTTQVQYNNAGAFAGDAGMTYDAANDALTVAGRIIASVFRPPSDGATGIVFSNAAGTTDFIRVNTTTGQVSIGSNIVPTARLQIDEINNAAPALKITHGTNSDVISVTKSTGTGALANVSFSSAQSDGILFANTDASTFLANRTMYGFKADLSTGVDLLGGVLAGYFRSVMTRTTKGTNADLAIGVEAIASSAITTAGVFGYAVRATASTKNITPVYAKVASSPASTDAAALDIVTSAGTRMFAIGPTGRIMTDQAAANTNTPSGATVKALPVYDGAGTLLGYIPVYAAQW